MKDKINAVGLLKAGVSYKVLVGSQVVGSKW